MQYSRRARSSALEGEFVPCSIAEALFLSILLSQPKTVEIILELMSSRELEASENTHY